MKCNKSKVSERYRKYVIAVQMPPSNNLFFLVWGTDMNDDEDKLWLDQDRNILAFSSIASLLESKDHNTTFSDMNNFELWRRHFSGSLPYAFYDLSKIESIIASKNFVLEHLSAKRIDDLINFYNLVADYKYQTNNQYLDSITNEKNMKLFFDWVYNNFFWNREGEQKQINAIDTTFNKNKFQEKYLEMITEFISHIKKS